jgi:hypothetical protein
MRGRPFEPGNQLRRGRPRGSRNKATLAAQQMLDSHGEALLRKCLVMALQGDSTALRLCMDRLLPPRRELPVKTKPMRLATAADVSNTLDSLMKGVAVGQITPGEAQTLSGILENRRRVIETEEHERRLRSLEEQNAQL